MFPTSSALLLTFSFSTPLLCHLSFFSGSRLAFLLQKQQSWDQKKRRVFLGVLLLPSGPSLVCCFRLSGVFVVCCSCPFLPWRAVSAFVVPHRCGVFAFVVLVSVLFSPLLSLGCVLFSWAKKQMGRFLLLSDPLPLVFLALDGSRQPKSKCLAGCAGQNIYIYIYNI